MTIRGELKKLVAKLGGTTSKDDQTAELIHKVTDNVSGGGSGDVVVVKCPVTIEGDVWTATKTAGELWAADIIIWEAGDNWAKILCQEKYYYSDATNYVFLVRILVNGQGKASVLQLEAGSAEDYPTTTGGD